jgi:phosphatidylinositol-3-phosphatase
MSRRARRPTRLRLRPLLGTVAILITVAASAAAGLTVPAAASPPRTHGKAAGQHTTSRHDLSLPRLTLPRKVSRPAPRTLGGNPICGTLVAHPARITHVVWIMMENRSYAEVIGAPYITTLASRCGVATNYHNVSHPSQPNYIAMTSGRPLGALPTTDCPTFCPVSGPSLFTQTNSWRVYAESMPVNCVRHDAPPYVVHHTAAPYYTAVTNCASNDVPLTALNLAALPAFSMIVPNVDNDMHERTSSVAAGDVWLRTHLGAILASPTYRSGSTVVFLTWDEGGFPRHTNNCATNTTDAGCHVALLVMSPYTMPGTRWTNLANHYSLLAATEQLLGLPYLGQAAAAPSIRTAFRL